METRPAAAHPELYACMVTDCWETWQVSLHESKVGAWKAGRAWLLARYESSHESRRLLGKSEYDFMNRHQSFRVAQLTVLP
jgi:hypothetical protein